MDMKGWMMGIKAALGMVYTPAPRMQSTDEFEKIVAQIDGMGQVADNILAAKPIDNIDVALEHLYDRGR